MSEDYDIGYADAEATYISSLEEAEMQVELDEEEINRLQAELAEKKKTIHGWLKENKEGGWIDNLRKKVALYEKTLQDCRRAFDSIRICSGFDSGIYYVANDIVYELDKVLKESDEKKG